ncbi:WD40-repeat-containing domain protein [Geranomyces variabilis]|nr:WD40-repeat-containing domain protein [Geranomyces variabilis]KAJ3134908.1 Serine/threonine-protein kinase smu1 [Geranomyces variabilis]
MSLEIEAADVIRLVQQFLKENNLLRTLQTLQEESTVALNTVDSVEGFASDIKHGRWDIVLKTVAQLNISQKKLVDLYEQITLELMELRELSAARSLLRQTDPMQYLKDHHPERYLHLEHLLSRTYFDEKEAYPNETTKEARRAAIAQALAQEVTVVAPSRLLALLGQALKWQHSQGLLPADTAYDLFRGAAPQSVAEDDSPPLECYNSIKFPKKGHAEAAAFSPDGQLLVTGSVDGFVEVWNYMTGKLRKDLKYQAEDNMMMMEGAVLSLAFSRDSEMLASGAQDGKIKVWKIQSGRCVRRFPTAHMQGVTSVSLSKDASLVLSSSFDHTIRIHGMKSGKLTKEFRGHSSFVNSATFSPDQTRIFSASSDGTAKIWDAKTQDCIRTIALSEGRVAPPGASSPTALSVFYLPRSSGERVVVCSRERWAYVLDPRGEVVRALSAASGSGHGDDDDVGGSGSGGGKAARAAVVAAASSSSADHVAAAASPKGEYVYAATESGELRAYAVDSGRLFATWKVVADGAEVVGVASHPFANVLAVYSDDGTVSLWKQ